MYDYKVPEADIATTYNRSLNYIRRVLDQNSDNTEEDYDHVDEKTKKLYPPRVSVVRRGPTQVSDCAD
jgi:hypothetical protein